MAEFSKSQRVARVLEGAREHTFETVLFHHTVGEILGVNVADMQCLAFVAHRESSSPSEIARHTGLSSGATTAMLDRLEVGGLITRTPNPCDRRGILIGLTPGATRRLTALFGSLRQAADRLASTYTNSELDLLADFLESVTTLWKDERAKLQQPQPRRQDRLAVHPSSRVG